MAAFPKGSKNLSFFIKIDRFSENFWTFLKKTKGTKFAVENDEIVRFLRTFKLLAVIKKYLDSPKKWIHFEMTEGRNFAVECNWNWQFSQNVQIIFAFQKK